MAHKIFLKPVPHINKDGSASSAKKDHEVWDRTRGGVKLLGRFSSKKAAEDNIPIYRDQIIEAHQNAHPNDLHHRRKHTEGRN